MDYKQMWQDAEDHNIKLQENVRQHKERIAALEAENKIHMQTIKVAVGKCAKLAAELKEGE